MQYSFLRSVLVLGLIAGISIGCVKPLESENKEVKVLPARSVETDKVQTPIEPKPAPNLLPVSKGEQESCVPKKEKSGYVQSDCSEGLVCAPNSEDQTEGSCRVSCGAIAADGKISKASEGCPTNRTCQTATSLSFDALGVYCLPQQTKRDAPCSAVTDKLACASDRMCAVSEVSKDDAGKPLATSLLCRDVCPFGSPKADESCSRGEKCIAYPYESTSQTSAEGEPVVCTESKCTGDFAECECDRANGFQCTALIPGVIAFCDRSAGICATQVPFVSASDFGAGGFSGETCNEVKGHAFCDNSLFQGVEKAGQSICYQFSEKTGDGICFAFCSVPALDIDGDGKLKGREQGQKYACPANYTCSTDLGRALGLVTPIPDAKAAGGRKSCDPSKCQAGKACLSECGVGDAECLTFEGKDGTSLNFCGAPLGSCELSASVS